MAFDVAMLVRSSPKMLLVSGLSYGINILTFAALVQLGHWRPEMAAIAAVSLVAVMNFLACRYFVFEARVGNVWRQVVLFAASTLTFRAAEIGTFTLLHHLTSQANVFALYVGVLACSYIVKYAVAGEFIFKNAAAVSARGKQ
jgi:putative flippase GtrA